MRWSLMNSKIAVLIPAAGQGRRMGSSVKKPYLRLADKPVLSHTIDRFEQNKVVDDIFVIVDESDFNTCISNILEPFQYNKVRELISGGDTRQRSVYNGLCALDDDIEYVIIHDGVRPFINDDIIRKCLEATAEWGAAVSAVPVKDTIKLVNDDLFVVDTPNRELLWRVQTPQVFRKSLIVAAHEKALKDESKAPDDATLVEKFGSPVKMVIGSYKNVKLTTPEDMRVAEVILSDELYL